MQSVKVSIIIVHYKAKKSLFDCLDSIYKTTTGLSFEIIVVDNDERKTIYNDLKKRFARVVYIPNENKGFAQGNNIGSKAARGEYLFFLNPDTIVYSDAISELVSYLKKNKNAGIAAPVLLDRDRKPYELQGFSTLTPLKAVFALSFTNRVWPQNPISKKYWLKNSIKEKLRKVDVVPGSAFMIRKDLFEKLGFDENFFLYFEENDLCKRVKDAGFEVVMIPKARVFHEWGVSTGKSNVNLKKIFRQSLFYYLKKHYGFLQALFVSIFLKINLQVIALLLIICLALYLRLFNLDNNMAFIGDQGWFYLSAKDILIHGDIPLVGIASSRPWLHQGPIWTYILTPALFLGNFNPLSGAYLTAILDITAILLIYKTGTEYFSRRVGIISAVIYAVSPAIIDNSRMPYHTSPIPLFVILLIYSILKWVKDRNPKYFALMLFSMSVLYNLHLATVIFWAVITGLFVFGFVRKKVWVTRLINKKYLTLSFLALVIPMVPVVIYDFYNGFPQTIRYAAWFIYKPLQALGFFPHAFDGHTYTEVGIFFLQFISRLLFPASIIVSIFILIIIFAVSSFYIKDKIISPLGIICSLTLCAVLAYFAAKTPSYAYLPMLFPGFILIFAVTMDRWFGKFKFLLILVIVLISGLNIHTIFSQINSGRDYFERKKAAEKIVKIAGGREYNLIGLGPGSEFENFAKNYEYLVWRLGNAPVSHPVELKIIVEENPAHSEVGVRIKNE